ncbi:hypothetical protein [Neobacillus drentensis]|uniref:hypothetical protein n=1 Tax=Neobacillus drentensis TaxID=220684 RepID=UPI0030004F9D
MYLIGGGGIPPTFEDIPPTFEGIPPTWAGFPPTFGIIPPTWARIPPNPYFEATKKESGCHEMTPLSSVLCCC